ncbi:MAG TPA: ribonuclease Z, partial [Mariniflexile sp.]|nr:ribonuclease Z [Mariniflexile sp.]
IYTNGFLFKEKEGNRKLDLGLVEDARIHVAYYRKLALGFDVINEDGELIKNKSVTNPGAKPKSYAFCSDTMYQETIVPIIKNVDVLYHESTFLEMHAHLATKTKHATAKQAATIAKKANAGVLLLGHYSTRYDSLEAFKEEANTVFELVELCEDGKVFNF